MLLFTGALWNWHPHVVGHTPGLQFCCDRRAVPRVRIHFPPAESQVRTCLTREFAFLRLEAAVSRGCAGWGERRGRQRRTRSSNIALMSGSVSVGRYSSTALSPMRFATVGAAERVCASLGIQQY